MCGGSSFHRRRFLAGVPRSTSSGSINLWIHRLRRTFGAVFGRGCGGRRSVCATPLYRYLCMPQLLYVCSFCMLCFCIPRRLPSEWRLLHTTSGYTKNPRFRRTGDRWCARRDSNPQPSDPQSDALSVELLAHVVSDIQEGYSAPQHPTNRRPVSLRTRGGRPTPR